MTEQESAHPENFQMSPEKVPAEIDDKCKRFNENSIPKRLLHYPSANRVKS